MEQKKQRHKAITFTLKGINPKQLEERYGLVLESNLGKISPPRFTTPIDGLSLNNSSDRLFSYFDESKKTHRCFCTMVNSSNEPLPCKTSTHCFWCRNQFSSIPIGVPLRYVHSQSVKSYYSEITKDTYKIRENISTQKRKDLELQIEQNKAKSHVSSDGDGIGDGDGDGDGDGEQPNISIDKKEYYITDGTFCSFNCAYAYILANEENAEYVLSKSLLTKMYENIFNTEFTIFPAPDWRLLQQYGGHLTIDEFREQFNKIEYIDLENRFSTKPIQYNSGKVFEQKIKF
jgi:hypothetical protein